MKLLLTSESIRNKSIEKALRSLLHKPSIECNLVYIPTSYNAAKGDKSWVLQNLNDVHQLGWKLFDIVDIAALTSNKAIDWMATINDADVIFVGGGNSEYLSYWLDRSGLGRALPKLLETRIYVGSSAGSMNIARSLNFSSKSIRDLEGDNQSTARSANTEQSLNKSLGLIGFDFRPHWGTPHFDYITEDLIMEQSRMYNSKIYAIDDNTAIKVDGDKVEVVSEGEWFLVENGVVTEDHRKTSLG